MLNHKNRFIALLTFFFAVLFAGTSSIAFADSPPIPVNSPVNVTATVNVPISVSIASNFSSGSGVDAYALINNNSLPPGIVLDARSGRLSGATASSGVWTAGILAHNAAGWTSALSPLTLQLAVNLR